MFYKMKTILLLTILIFVSLLSYSQENKNTVNKKINHENTVKKQKESYRKIKKRKSKEQIQQLKNGILLIRLKTSENKINALIEMGKIEKANKIKTKQYIENKAILATFKNRFKFCKTAFFYSNKSKYIQENKFSNIFLNDSLLIDSTIVIDSKKPIFIAEFGTLEPDTMIYFSHYSYEPNSDFSVKKTEHYYSSSSNIDIYALIIKDQNFIQLNKPFPYYTRAIFKTIKESPGQMIFIPLALYYAFCEKSYSRTIEKMDVKLLKYYNKAIKRQAI
ncbi:MAG: hypothetical protein COZ21_12805 [Bacteroidetes bacterium CG_4_10_14_3_um_filter_31_20]|nr:MAG: hypothetical protein COZ59_13160 [Bacteroidetes bacterium CG_4_8_14_3_um_filter_31_14]PIY02699.1 MAG: hypothetical protein COZ21_12805 [Bacteroidetes bacterium CG_4_10_14_3_um_filter_31_20]